MSNTDKIDEVVYNQVIISKNQKNILVNQKIILFFLNSNNYILILFNIFQLILDLTFINLIVDKVSYLADIKIQLDKIDFWLNKNIFDFENICKDQETIYTHIDLIFDNLTHNIKLLIHVTETNKISNQLLTLDSYIKDIKQFNIIIKNHAIIKEYITSVRAILSKSIVSFEKARFMWYNYNVSIQKTNTIITTENKKRKLEVLNVDQVFLDDTDQVDLDDIDEVNLDDNNDNKFYLSSESKAK